MKNFWLDRRGPSNKTKINIWLSASITGDKEELIGFVEARANADDPQDRLLVETTNPGMMYSTNAKLVIPVEIDKMLWNLRIGKALGKRRNECQFNGKEITPQLLNEQWTPGPGNKLCTQFGMMFVKEDKPDPRYVPPTVIIEK